MLKLRDEDDCGPQQEFQDLRKCQEHSNIQIELRSSHSIDLFRLEHSFQTSQNDPIKKPSSFAEPTVEY